MRKTMLTAPVLLTFVFPGILRPCDCITAFSVCDEVKMSDAVFIGTVESVTDMKSILAAAKTPEEAKSIMASLVLQDTSATLRIKTLFRRPGDDDDDKKPDQKDNKKDDDKDDHKHDPNSRIKEGGSVVVWTDSGDCGFVFHKGETYLVYAVEDETSGQLQTTVCNRTARVSDAGGDLAYLFFYQNGGSQSARLEGFATSAVTKLDQDRFHYTGRIASPVSNIVVELQTPHDSLYAAPDPNGRFIFDGLAEGAYKLFAYAQDDPLYHRPLASSLTLQVKPKSCVNTVLFVPNGRLQH
jgi:hypothetical protein